MIEIFSWRRLDRWDAFTIPHLHIAPHQTTARIGDLLQARHDRVDRTKWRFDQLQPISIHFGGDISRRIMPEGREYSLPMFWAKPGDVVLSKIDLKNGAVGVLPEGWDNVVVTSHFKVYQPDLTRLHAPFFRLLLQTQDFKKWLWANRSGADGRTEVKLDVFENLEIPLPSLSRQYDLTNTYADAIARAAALEPEAEALEQEGIRAFETALGVAPPPPLPERPVLVARFKDIERWSHDGILRQITYQTYSTPNWPMARLGDVIADLENGWSPKCNEYPASASNWGVLKLGAVSFGMFDESQNKELPERLKPRPEHEVREGDVLISRANVVKYVGACVYVEKTRPKLMLCDKIFRVVFREDNPVNPGFLAEIMRVSSVREQIESRLTGTSPTMKNIAKPALLDLSFPLPTPEQQEILVDAIKQARREAAAKRSEAQALRAKAWADFESALFEAKP